MIITPNILQMLRCPAGGGALVLADRQLIERVNAAISDGTARDQLDARVDEPIDAGVVNTARNRLYPIRDNITTLIADDAIRIDNLGAGQTPGLS
ncbi:Trm112 family protein [Allorhodopirellula heiligendammensis]|uniref:Trm112p-like protein n=1 Tax=Allorhodopirellula heiligendammensis TaxID=2714739 RepID=A0A5C6BXU0_9BACT|nr:Trm112 family protein [Allorhodopirellula heiligendammensis]TWU16477.1 hypothetical protein Poly21_36820 [Allorhodopirellula heiligendammensis]